MNQHSLHKSIKFIFYLLIICLLPTKFSHCQYSLQEAFPNLSFDNPLFLTNSGDGTNRIFVVEQAGIIKVFPDSSSSSSAKIFLDITDSIISGNELGLLGLAFHPDYENNGYFYVNYTTDDPVLRTVIARFQVTSNPDSADKNSKFEIITFNQPYANHNGGWIGFGPNDGYLYIATGDGGSGGDPQNNGQRINTFLGKILRIDIDGAVPYAIPLTNPFYDSTNIQVRKEIYAWGFRNPWRCSFDNTTNRFWVADVGQYDWEEVDIVTSGKNYGWRCYEGNHDYNTSGCNYPEYVFPIWEYSHSSGYSITGGYVYRGPGLPELTGKYIYADYGTRKVWALSYDGISQTTNELLLTAPGSVTSFGEDEFHELYITSFNGKIYKFSPTTGCGDINLVTGWNLISVPFLSNNMLASDIFPTRASNVFGYNNNLYYIADSLQNGVGYWVKYNNPISIPVCGVRVSDTIQVNSGWNIIGPFDEQVSAVNVISTPPDIIISEFFGFDTVYITVDTLEPGKGYWIKTSSAGTINFNTNLKR